mgnify:CR=1 FL=1
MKKAVWLNVVVATLIAVGALCSPFFAAAVFSYDPSLTMNGWVLALLGSVESVVAGTTVIAAARLNRWFFLQRMRRALRVLASGQPD